jgi:hypothetical protein
MRERRRDHGCESRAHRECRLAASREADDGRPHLGWRLERARADIEQRFGFQPWGEHHRETAVVAVAGCGGDAVYDFPLQHHVHVVDCVDVLQEMEEERRGDVVGQVADYAQPLGAALAREGGEVEGEGVGFVDGEARLVGKLGLQLRDEVAVDFDGVEGASFGVEQCARQCASPRTDFH